MGTDPHAWLEHNPYARDLGVRLAAVEDDAVRVTLPYDERNTAIRSMHGGAIASLAGMSAQAALRATGAGPACTISLHVGFAGAARGSEFTAHARLIRRARELGFVDACITNEEGTELATATATLSEDRSCDTLAPEHPPVTGDPAVFNSAMDTVPFLSRRGLRVTGIEPGLLEASMPPIAPNLDGDGSVHEGAVLAFIDGVGASVPWTMVPPSADSWGSTVALHAQILGTLPAGELLAHGRVRASDARVYWCDVTVYGAGDRRLHALGSVVYRLSAAPGTTS